MIPKNDQKKRMKTRLKHEIEEDIEEYFSEIKPNTDITFEELERLVSGTEKGIVGTEELVQDKEIGS
jgi:hypothetical protein